jgi:hypothetical protein
MVGFGIRRLRSMSNRAVSRETRWDRVEGGRVPSGWGNIQKPDIVDNFVHFFYEKIQFAGSRRPGRGDHRNWATDVPEHVMPPEQEQEDTYQPGDTR